MDEKEALEWLNKRWEWMLDSDFRNEDAEIDALVNADVLSVRYALITQILGKIADERRGLLHIQKGDEKDPLAWDARSFCNKVVVPWVSGNHNVLGSSQDPYVSHPLRRPRLDVDLDRRKHRDQWSSLVEFLAPLNEVDQEYLKRVFDDCLASVARRLTRHSISYQIPARVSLPRMLVLLEEYLDEASGGFRPLAVAVSLMNVLGRAFSIFGQVKSQKVNEADSQAGVPGDVMCYDQDGEIALAIEVKDRDLTLADVRTSTVKAQKSERSVYNLLFVSPNLKDADSDEIQRFAHQVWPSGLNINQIDIIDLTRAAFVLLAENKRTEFLREISDELDRSSDLKHRLAWYGRLVDLSTIGSGRIHVHHSKDEKTG